MDEKPIQFFADSRKGFRSKKSGTQYEYYEIYPQWYSEYFLFTEPLVGWRYADAQEHRIRQYWAKQIDWLLTEQYPKAKKVVLVMDNLNTHNIASLYATFPPEYASMLAEHLEIHYTPKHGNWLDIAGIELSALGRQCVSNNRIPDMPTLRSLLSSWVCSRNKRQKGVDWHSLILMPELNLIKVDFNVQVEEFIQLFIMSKVFPPKRLIEFVRIKFIFPCLQIISIFINL